MTPVVLSRLTKALGPSVAGQLTKDGLMKLGLNELRTPDELLVFANYLLTHGGVIESVGRALKVSAILRGARED
jgi:hypothetical protein